MQNHQSPILCCTLNRSVFWAANKLCRFALTNRTFLESCIFLSQISKECGEEPPCLPRIRLRISNLRTHPQLTTLPTGSTAKLRHELLLPPIEDAELAMLSLKVLHDDLTELGELRVGQQAYFKQRCRDGVFSGIMTQSIWFRKDECNIDFAEQAEMLNKLNATVSWAQSTILSVEELLEQAKAIITTTDANLRDVGARNTHARAGWETQRLVSWVRRVIVDVEAMGKINMASREAVQIQREKMEQAIYKT